jgi:ssDNA-binding replication factor A large subunit
MAVKFSLDEIIKEISRSSGLSEEDVKQKIEDKQMELSGLISPEGAAYIVGKELGVNLIKESYERKLKIENILPGMKSVDICGRVIEINKRGFEKEGKSKSVVNVLIGDETGIIRLSLWDEEISIFENLGIHEGDVISVKNGYSKENSLGNVELRLGRFGRLTKIEMDMPGIEEIKESFGTLRSIKRKQIYELNEGEYAEIRGCLVQIFKKGLFFEVCPKCEVRLEKVESGWKCKEHGRVEPKYNLFLSGVVDDGTGNIHVVFFRELVEKVLEKDSETLRKMMEKNEISEIYQSQLGKELLIKGRVRKNELTNKMEIIADSVEIINPLNEVKKILAKLDGDKN